jgi:hypothetical protein
MTALSRWAPSWAFALSAELYEQRQTLERMERNMADTSALTAAVNNLTTAVTALAARVAASATDQPAIDAAVQGVNDAVTAMNAIDPATMVPPPQA